MIKTILVPATGSDTDTAVFGSALAVARPFGGHLDVLHVRIDAATTAATIASDVSSPQVVTDLINKMEKEAEQREAKAKQLIESFCRRGGLALAETPPGPSAPSARWLRVVGSESYWLLEYARAADLLIIGRPSDDQIAPSDVLESALIKAARRY
jgi:universal stress protein family protein